jgi:hypothetical protein
MQDRNQRLRRWIVVPMLAAAVAAPTAQAMRPDDRGGSRGPSVVASAGRSAPVRPDDRAEIRGGRPLSTVAVHAHTAGFHWRDGTIGGVLGFAFALVAIGTATLISHRRRGAPRPA